GDQPEAPPRPLVAVLEEQLHPQADAQPPPPGGEPLLEGGPEWLQPLHRRGEGPHPGKDHQGRRSHLSLPGGEDRVRPGPGQGLEQGVDVAPPGVQHRPPHRSTSSRAPRSRSIPSHGPTPTRIAPPATSGSTRTRIPRPRSAAPTRVGSGTGMQTKFAADGNADSPSLRSSVSSGSRLSTASRTWRRTQPRSSRRAATAARRPSAFTLYGPRTSSSARTTSGAASP